MNKVYPLLCFLTTLIFQTAQAASFEYTPYIISGISYQSNLFLVADSQEAREVLDTTEQSDTILSLSPGVRGTVEHQRQQFLFDVSLLRKEFDHFDSLNFNGGNAKLQWDWLAGRNWQGIASYKYSKEQSNFNEQLGLRGDSSEIDRYTFTANRKITPHYTILTGVTYKLHDYKRRRLLDTDQLQSQLGLRYTSLANNSIDLLIENTDAEYPNRNERSVARGLDDGFSTNSLLLRTRWQVTRKSLFDIEAGYLDRQQDTIKEDDFSGVIGSLRYSWALTGKTMLSSSIWRDLRDSEDQVSNFIKSTGANIRLDWNASSKITFTTQVSQENKKYQSSDVVSELSNREDDVFSTNAALKYKLRRNISLTADYYYENRDSNQNLRDFKNNIASLILEVDF